MQGQGKKNSGLSYSSKIDSVSYTCGHDAHTSILLGTAKLLFSKIKKHKGKIYFIFQPAEETKGGADDIVNSGIPKTLNIQNIYALHSTSGL
ncbi:MAG: M20/M25/M40 family metallo-hydrolase [Bacteroidetes bacterium]|nr:M20/M25/M40 family metallo-hydrolase [Bacteroidota bacterium]